MSEFVLLRQQILNLTCFLLKILKSINFLQADVFIFKSINQVVMNMTFQLVLHPSSKIGVFQVPIVDASCLRNRTVIKPSFQAISPSRTKSDGAGGFFAISFIALDNAK
ncbi:hypothetical protein AVEN_38736-1 [Araneus ventricosus]|uniref:Uncharacterized protein n=1 Tax=Araneus ventricosus TaxID=182803 RepID=A0A4Y2QNU6_ARAVE|nr:hypothetical protein AVEN_38736-1 [Araneus ventricosus]